MKHCSQALRLNHVGFVGELDIGEAARSIRRAECRLPCGTSPTA